MTPTLSRREWDVLTLIADGLSNAAIAQRLCLEPTTVGRHISGVYNKLGVGGEDESPRVLATLWYMRQCGLTQGLSMETTLGELVTALGRKDGGPPPIPEWEQYVP